MSLLSDCSSVALQLGGSEPDTDGCQDQNSEDDDPSNHTSFILEHSLAVFSFKSFSASTASAGANTSVLAFTDAFWGCVFVLALLKDDNISALMDFLVS